MNYIKSEFYRAFRSPSIYYLTGTLAVLSVLINLVLWLFARTDDPAFPYNTTSFSFSCLVSSPMFFCIIAALISIFLYEGNRKHGNMKNTIAFGISRTNVFVGQCIVTTVMAIISLMIILPLYITSAFIFLRHIGPVSLMDLLTEIPAIFFIAIASLISAIVLIETSGKDAVAMIIWFVIWFIIPKIFFYLGLRIDFFYKIAMWMPANFFSTAVMSVNMSQSITAWQTAAGMTKCLVSGIGGIIICSIAGIILLRKKEI